MKRQVFLTIAAGFVLGWIAGPARSQAGCPFQFPTPVSLRASGGTYTVRWEDVPPNGIDPGLYSLTWYYSPSRDGAERKRMATLFRDDFSGGGFRANWSPEGQFVFDWDLKEERRNGKKRFYLSGPESGRAVSRRGMPQDSVVSILARPDGFRGKVGVGVRTQERAEKAYWLLADSTTLRLMRGDQEIKKQRMRPTLRLNDWYWFEIGMRNRRRKDVVIRVRVFDEKRERLLATMDLDDKCPDRQLFREGLVSLTGPAHFAEVYVDPWEARWADDDANQFTWSTSDVPEGRYYLFAEVADTEVRTRPVLIGSGFQVQIGSGSQARND